jgi:hypothetical protein
MKMKHLFGFRQITYALLPVLILFSFSCRPGISLFSEQAYQQAVYLKTASLRFMDLAVEPFELHADEAEQLLFEIETAYEYAKGRPDNELSTRQWELLKDPERNLLGGFIQRWRDEETLSPAFVREARGVISDAFDSIIGLESGKIKPSEVQ